MTWFAIFVLMTIYQLSKVMTETKIPTKQSSSSTSELDRWTKGSQSAHNRIERGIVIPEWQPSFEIPPHGQVFAIGSCFARNIERELLGLGVRVTSVVPESDLLEIRTNLQLGLLNKYNPISIHQELAWAASLSDFPEQGFIEFQGKYLDPYLRQQTRRGDLALMQSRRIALQKYFAQAFQANLVIVTLGLTESWFDRQTKLALTEIPSPRLMKEFPERFGFKQLFYPECITVLKSIYKLLKQYGKPDLKIVFTLSPVALDRTFTGQDVIVANMMSKSTLRSAIGELVAKVDGVDYFPSYEAVMLSDPLLAYQSDRRRVTDLIVSEIMTEFTRRYGLRGMATLEEKRDNYRQIAEKRLAITQNKVLLCQKMLTKI